MNDQSAACVFAKPEKCGLKERSSRLGDQVDQRLSVFESPATWLGDSNTCAPGAQQRPTKSGAPRETNLGTHAILDSLRLMNV